jgi:hypothetical protein
MQWAAGHLIYLKKLIVADLMFLLRFSAGGLIRSGLRHILTGLIYVKPVVTRAIMQTKLTLIGRKNRCTHAHMNTALTPIESEFATTEEAEAHDRWFRAKVQASLNDERPSIPHDQVMAEMDAIIIEAEQRNSRKQA